VIVFNMPGDWASYVIPGSLFGVWLLSSAYPIARLVFAEQPPKRLLRWLVNADLALVVVLVAAAALVRDTRFDYGSVYSVPLVGWDRPRTEDVLKDIDRSLSSLAEEREELTKSDLE
jgi:hypothetical protein